MFFGISHLVEIVPVIFRAAAAGLALKSFIQVVAATSAPDMVHVKLLDMNKKFAVGSFFEQFDYFARCWIVLYFSNFLAAHSTADFKIFKPTPNIVSTVIQAKTYQKS